MESVRPIVVNKDMVILGGNMRYKAMIECGYKEVNVEVVDWSEQKQNEFIIKDNVGFGEWEWEMVANEWNMEEIEEWGLDLPLFDKHIEEAELKDLSDKLKSEFKIEIICKDEEEQEKTYNKLIEENYECRLLTL